MLINLVPAGIRDNSNCRVYSQLVRYIHADISTVIILPGSSPLITIIIHLNILMQNLQYTPDLLRTNHEKCLFSVRIINRLKQTHSCLRCFCNTGIIFNVLAFELVFSHHIASGPYTPLICTFCKQNLVANQPIANCKLCLEAYTKIAAHCRLLQFDRNAVHYLYDVLSQNFESFKQL